MPVLVLGGSGIVGSCIRRQLILCGESHYSVSRKVRSDRDGTNWIRADLERPFEVTLPPWETAYSTVHPALLATALPYIATKATRRIVCFTSTSIVTKKESEIVSERDNLRALAEGEAFLRRTCEDLGLEWTVLRPTLIYAEGRDANISRIAAFISRFGFFPLWGSARGLRQPVHAEDLATGAIKAARSKQAIGKIYALPGGETITYREMVGRVFDGLGRRRVLIPVPPVMWKLAFHALRPLVPDVNVAMGSRMSKDMTFDLSEAARDFGWAPRPFHPVFEVDWKARSSRMNGTL